MSLLIQRIFSFTCYNIIIRAIIHRACAIARGGEKQVISTFAEMQEREASSMRAVAFKYAIPPTTLHDHLKQKAKKIGAGGLYTIGGLDWTGLDWNSRIFTLCTRCSIARALP